jgi:tetratricopeptide (TPR) repeat protein
MMMAQIEIGTLRWYQGRCDEASSIFMELAEAFPRIAGYHGAAGICYFEAGQIAESRRVLDEANARGLDRVRHAFEMMTALVYYTMLAVALDDRRAVATLYEQIAAATELAVWNGATAYGAIDAYRGMLAATMGRHEEAEARLAAGVELNDRMGAVIWATRARLFWAELLIERGEPGDHERAGQLFARARADAERLGTPALLERAEAGLAHAMA